MKKRNLDKCGSVSTLLTGLVLCAVVSMSGCALFSSGRSVYDHDGIWIGIDADPSVRRSIQTDLNNHSIDVAPKELESLLQVIEVSGFSGTLVGMFTKPQPVPLFTPQELSMISGHLAAAFREAKPTERVSFSLPKPNVRYSEDRTVGFLFFRGRYLHVIVTDHSSVIRTDAAGGDYRDVRDTKGMRLWIAGPAQAAMVPDVEEPRWAHFERVHISLDVKRVLARKANVPAASMDQMEAETPVSLPGAGPPESRQGSASPKDLQLQIRELSGANQELKIRLDEQNKRTQQLQDQIEQLRRELPQLAPKKNPHNTIPAQ